jgi:hypothetical protein
MLRAILVSGALATCLFTAAYVVSAQDTRARANDLVAQLDKTKHKVKDKRGTHFESYTEVRNEAAALKPGDLAGHYVSKDSPEFWMDLRVSSDGTATANGIGYEMVGENSVRIAYTFKGRIEGALLTGTRTLENGRTEPFEAAFVNRTVREGTNETDASVTYKGFGLGYIQQDEHWTNRVFLEKR